MPSTTPQTQIQIPAAPIEPQPMQGDLTTTLIIAIAFLIKTIALSIAVIIKASKR